ncbi:MAG: trypsin-like peptidase domain-containing protein [Pirellulales bacterium]
MRTSPVFCLVSLTIGIALSTAAARAADGIEASVVKLNVTKRKPDYFRPWTKESPEKISGSGVVIAGKRILTNAHMVTNASQVFVQMRRGGDQLSAKVKAVGPGIDLAVIELDDVDKLKDVPALSLAEELPQIKSQISVYGYPTGGDDLSITDGIVSRIEFTEYYYGASGVRVQVDAALNPGNSGGPAIEQGKIVGLVFSGIQEAENIGYLIPPEEIRLFLADVADGAYTGNPLLFDEFQTAENDALRAFLKIPANVTGLVVTRPYRKDETYPLKTWDLVTHVGQHAIDNQGYVDVREGLRMRFMYFVPRFAKDGRVELTVLRGGATHKVSVPVAAQRDFLLPLLKDQYPEYFIYGPVVFTVASQEYVRELGDDWTESLAYRESPLVTRLYDQPAEPGEQLVVIANQMFPHATIRGFDNRGMSVIAKLNGVKVKNLRHLAELLRDRREEFLRFEMVDRNESLVFRRAELEAATEQILADEGIRYRASESLRDVWKTN